MYPEMRTIRRDEFNEMVEKEALIWQNAAKEAWKEISPNGTLSCAVANNIRLFGYDCEQATKEALHDMKLATQPLEAFELDVKIAVMNTPFAIDRKLKWRCPLPYVRKYLQVQCGVKERWYYKLFWRGKKLFRYYF
jgi:hypothetical protein